MCMFVLRMHKCHQKSRLLSVISGVVQFHPVYFVYPFFLPSTVFPLSFSSLQMSTSSLGRTLLAARSFTLLPRASMYNNPYIARFKKRSKVTEGFYKKTTGLTGLFVNEHPHRSLTVVYSRILKALQQMPANYAYRTFTEQVVKRRLAIVQAEDNIQELEKKIGMGQIEEVIEQAEYELEACRSILDNKAWEPLVEEAPKNQWTWPIA